jgi:hypothetical protein
VLRFGFQGDPDPHRRRFSRNPRFFLGYLSPLFDAYYETDFSERVGGLAPGVRRTMALKPITEFIAALRGMSLPSLPAARIGETTPKAIGDLPSVRVVASALAFAPLGIGGSRRVRLDPSDILVEEVGRRVTGTLNLEVWGGDEDGINQIASAAAEQTAAAETDLLKRGFLRLRQSAWQPAVDAPLRGASPAAAALKLVLAYDMIFEDIQTAPAGPEAPIREVDVHVFPKIEAGAEGAENEEDMQIRKT